MSLTYDGGVPTVSTKKKCCKDSPRCKKCPVTLNRLRKAGYAEQLSRTSYAMAKDIPRKTLKAARAA